MDMEFHYYITYLITTRAGFDAKTAQTIAYASQYVDDNDIVYEISANSPQAYSNYISQTINILAPQSKLLRIYPLFHFVPGEYSQDSTRRCDGKLHLLNTTPNSKNARDILSSALNTQNPYRIGLACHTYADTWAHQNFTGNYDVFNAIKSGILSRWIIPRIGHAGARKDPDRINMTWEDPRLIQSLSNRENTPIYLEAVRCMFEHMRRHINANCPSSRVSSDGDKLIKDIRTAIGGTKPADGTSRIKRYRSLSRMPEYGGNELEEYDVDAWMDHAVNEEVRAFRIRAKTVIRRQLLDMFSKAVPKVRDIYTWRDPDNYTSTDWYSFQVAVKEHQAEAQEILQPVFSQMGLENW